MMAPNLKFFGNLHTAGNKKTWSPLTCCRAPHKPFLLLAILDLICQGQITGPFISPSLELAETFNGYWSLVMPPSRRGLPSYPFYHLRSEPFWELVPNNGFTDKSGRSIISMSMIRKIYAGAGIDERLFAAMVDPVHRELLRKVLVETYFDKSIQIMVAEQGIVNLVAYTYAAELSTGVHETADGSPVDRDASLLARFLLLDFNLVARLQYEITLQNTNPASNDC